MLKIIIVCVLEFLCVCLSHIVGHVNGIEHVVEEAVAQVHALLLAAAVDGHNARVDHHHHANDNVVILEHYVRNERYEVERLALAVVQLHHDHEQIRPRETCTKKLRLEFNK